MSTVQHVSLWSKSPALPMLETRPESKHSLIFIAGLSDTLATVPYLASLAEAIAPLDFSLIQPQLSSSLGGYGLSSLEADAQEICILIDHLQTRSIHPKPKDGKMVIMGHSTGCQDVAHLLSQHREGIQVDGAILQAPVSDREYFEAENEAGDDDYKLLEEATALVKAGKGSTLLERHIDAPRVAPPTFKEYEVNGDAFQDPAMTAYRFWSLNAKGGDDDFFSSDLTEERISEIWRNTIDRGHRVLAMLGKLDEYYPDHISPQHLADQWSKVVKQIGSSYEDRFKAVVLSNGNHKVESSEGQRELVQSVQSMLEEVIKDARESEEHDHVPSSFDEVVELITTGKADSIPGVKKIPLKINEESPSQSQMQRPAKPWEKIA